MFAPPSREIWRILREGGPGAVTLFPSLVALFERLEPLCEIEVVFDAPALVQIFGKRVHIFLHRLPKQGYFALVHACFPSSNTLGGALAGPFYAVEEFWRFVRDFLVLPEDENSGWFDGATLRVKSSVYIPACVKAFAQTE